MTPTELIAKAKEIVSRRPDFWASKAALRHCEGYTRRADDSGTQDVKELSLAAAALLLFAAGSADEDLEQLLARIERMEGLRDTDPEVLRGYMWSGLDAVEHDADGLAGATPAWPLRRSLPELLVPYLAPLAAVPPFNDESRFASILMVAGLRALKGDDCTRIVWLLLDFLHDARGQKPTEDRIRKFANLSAILASMTPNSRCGVDAPWSDYVAHLGEHLDKMLETSGLPPVHLTLEMLRKDDTPEKEDA